MSAGLSISCNDEQRNPVDWFVALRLKSGTSGQRVYIIMTNQSKQQWNFADESEIIAPLFNQVDLNVHKGVFWNDEPTNGKKPSTTYAHDKGMLFFDPKDKTGVLINHSVPLFPNINGNKVDPVSNLASDYGQSFVCFSIKNDAETFMRQVYANLVKTNAYFW
jgi:hypothetical protein